MPNVFVSYRRKDSTDVTGRIFDSMKSIIGPEHLFKDVDSIPLGSEFRSVIAKAIEQCDVLLAVIGDRWLDAQDEMGRRRIDVPDDYVAVEIKSALGRGIPVIPVILGQAELPKPEELPPALQPLLYRNAIRVRPDPDFHHDMDRLCQELTKILKVPDLRKRQATRKKVWGATLGLAMLTLVTAAFILAKRNPSTIPSATINQMTVVSNMTVIVQEYERSRGRPIEETLRAEIERALVEVKQDTTEDSLKLLEEVLQRAPLPSIYTNLGVAQARLGHNEEAREAFTKALEAEPNYQPALTNQSLLEAALAKTPPITIASDKVVIEPSPLTSMLVKPLGEHAAGCKELHVVDAGTNLSNFYTIRYELQPATPVVVDPGKYDIVFKGSGGGTFLLIRDIEVKEGTRATVDAAAILGSLVVDPVTKEGFPKITRLLVFEAGTSGYRQVWQEADRLGGSLSLVPGKYDLVCKTAEGDEVEMATNVEIVAGKNTRVKSAEYLSAILVQEPKLAGAQVNRIYVLKSGTMNRVAERKTFGQPMLVPANQTYDIGLDQAAGVARIKSKVLAKPGELIEVP